MRSHRTQVSTQQSELVTQDRLKAVVNCREVQVAADLDGIIREGEAWFRVDRERRHLEWGSEGPNDYHGYLDITGDGGTSLVTVFLHTERHDSGEIDRGITETLAAVKRLVEAGQAPGSAS